MPKVEIYSSALCGYCRAAKQVLSQKGIEIEEYSVDLEPQVRVEMIKRASGRTSVPQIFIDGAHVGGFDDLMMLEAGDELDALLGLDSSEARR